MDHSEALAIQAAEKYLLGELSEDQLSAFEEHYFGCPECASDLETGVLFVRHARAVFREGAGAGAVVREAPRHPASSETGSSASVWSALADLFRRPFIPGLAAAALAALCIYQGVFLIPELRRTTERLASAQPLPAYQLVQAVRGVEKTVSVPPGAAFFAVSFDVIWERPYPHYRCKLTDSGGRPRFSIVVPAPAPGQPVSILAPSRGLDNGKYTLTISPVVEAAAGQPPQATYEFNLKFE
jgi:hypothetical protein